MRKWLRLMFIRSARIPCFMVVVKLVLGPDRAPVSTLLCTFSQDCIRSAASKLSKLAPFDRKFFAQANRAIGATESQAEVQAILFGCPFICPLFSEEAILKASSDPTPTNTAFCDGLEAGANSDLTIGVFALRGGNEFMKRIALELQIDILSTGRTALLLDETSSIENRPDVCIFLAPHEFFYNSGGRRWLREDVITNSYMFATEQLQTVWFAQSLPILLMARGVIDLNRQMASMLKEAGVPSIHWMPGQELDNPIEFKELVHEDFEGLPPLVRGPGTRFSDTESREIDVAFWGARSPRRDLFLTEFEGRLRRHVSYLHCPRPSEKRARIPSDCSRLELCDHLALHSKILLNIHQGEVQYFEWHRMVLQGMGSGAVVVSDPCVAGPIFKAGVHYFEAGLENICDLIDWLLLTDEGKRSAEQVRANAFQAIRAHYSINDAGKQICAFLGSSRARATEPR
jgi:hypothetical protein